jgi:Txe/YoeB family toxin of Txe-Axe toxin-antitoxin module
MKVKIYALINSLNDTVFYIGCTKSDLKARLSNHISRRTDCTKNRFIYNILVAGGKVEILELDEVAFENGSFWEQHYIDLFLSFGYKLIQRRTSAYNECKPENRARGLRSWSKMGIKVLKDNPEREFKYVST